MRAGEGAAFIAGDQEKGLNFIVVALSGGTWYCGWPASARSPGECRKSRRTGRWAVAQLGARQR